MRHGKKGYKLGRTRAHRQATLAALSNALIRHKSVRTTLTKAKALRTYVEPLITRSKDDTTHNRRLVFSYLQDKDSIKELFDEISERVAERHGGYTRVVKLGQRTGDGAEMAVIELVDYNETGPETTGRRRRTRRGGGRGRQGRKAEAAAAASTAAAKKPVAETVEEAAVAEETGVVETIKDVAEEVADTLKETAAEVVDTVEDMVEGAAETFEDMIGTSAEEEAEAPAAEAPEAEATAVEEAVEAPVEALAEEEIPEQPAAEEVAEAPAAAETEQPEASAEEPGEDEEKKEE